MRINAHPVHTRMWIQTPGKWTNARTWTRTPRYMQGTGCTRELASSTSRPKEDSANPSAALATLAVALSSLRIFRPRSRLANSAKTMILNLRLQDLDVVCIQLSLPAGYAHKVLPTHEQVCVTPARCVWVSDNFCDLELDRIAITHACFLRGSHACFLRGSLSFLLAGHAN